MDGGRVTLAPEGQIGGILDFCLGLRFEEIPAEDLERVELLLLDLIAVAAGAEGTDASRITHETALALYGAGQSQAPARLLFDGRQASPAGAAFAGASQIDNIDAHDGYTPGKGHVGVVLLPALLAFADSLGRPVSGREALSGLVMGYEFGSRAALALHGTVGDYHTSGAWNALAVAALGCRLRGRPGTELREAFGRAFGRRLRRIPVPDLLVDVAAAITDAVAWMTRSVPVFGRQKAIELKARWWVCSSRRAEEEIGWRPRIGLAEGVAETAQWYRESGRLPR